MTTIVIVVALPEERGYFHKTIAQRHGWTVDKEATRYRGVLRTEAGKVQILVHTLASMGLVEAVLGASSVIAASSPDLVLVIGISGALDHATVGLGDVVISNRAKLYASDKVASINPRYRFDAGLVGERPPNEIWVDSRDRFMANSFLRYERKYVELGRVDELLDDVQPHLLTRPLKSPDLGSVPKEFQALQSMQRGRKLQRGWVLGSHHVVDSPEYRAYLVEKNVRTERDVHRQAGEPQRVRWADGDLLAVDMESYGVLRAVDAVAGRPPKEGGSRNLLGGIAIRGISDMCEGKKATDDFGQPGAIRKLAIDNAAEICLSLIEGLDHRRIASGRQ